MCTISTDWIQRKVFRYETKSKALLTQKDLIEQTMNRYLFGY